MPCATAGKPIILLLLSEGQMSHNGAFLLLDALPRARELPCDKGYNSNWFAPP